MPVGGGGGGMPTAGSGGTGGGVTASGSPPFNEKPPVNLNGQLSPAQLLWPDSWGQLPCEFGPCSGLGPDGFVTGTQAAGVGVAALGEAACIILEPCGLGEVVADLALAAAFAYANRQPKGKLSGACYLYEDFRPEPDFGQHECIYQCPNLKTVHLPLPSGQSCPPSIFVQ